MNTLKKMMRILVVLMTTFIVNQGCMKLFVDPCTGVICEANEYCKDGDCVPCINENCPVDSLDENTPIDIPVDTTDTIGGNEPDTLFFIFTSVTVTAFPEKDPDDKKWDTGFGGYENPDVYVVLYQSSFKIWQSIETVTNANPNNSTSFTPNAEVYFDNFNVNLQLTLMDEDINDDATVGNVFFELASRVPSGQTGNVSWNLSNNGVDVTIHGRFQYK